MEMGFFGLGLYDGGYVDFGLFLLVVYGFYLCYGNFVFSELVEGVDGMSG